MQSYTVYSVRKWGEQLVEHFVDFSRDSVFPSGLFGLSSSMAFLISAWVNSLSSAIWLGSLNFVLILLWWSESSVRLSVVIKWSSIAWMFSLRLDVYEPLDFSRVVMGSTLLCLFVVIL